MDLLNGLLGGLALLFEPHNLLLLLIGGMVGLVFGILPGLGGPVTVALLLPFIYGMSPDSAFAFLLGMLAAQGTASDVTAVLFGVPGDVSSATTVLDGHAMARNGEGGRALGLVLASSVVGGLFGALILAASIPIVRPLVLALGPPEYFVLAFVALLFISALSQGRLLHGYLMACLGFIVGFVGLDPQAGVPRYTFDNLYLWSGVPIVPLVLGLFAIPEVVKMGLAKPVETTSGETVRRPATSSVLSGVRESARYWRQSIRAGGIGAGVGIIPGIGGSVSQWIAYADAKTRSKNPERFGKGAPDGLVTSGAVNNGRDGGQLVPTLAFGVPGSGTMAVFLGAFLIVGLVPGPSMLSENLDITFLAVWSIVLCNLIAIGLLAPVLRPLSRIASLRESVLVPGVLAIVFMGTYTNARNWNDILVLAIAGAIGIIGARYNWPIIPFLLAYVLGDIAERNLLISVASHGSTGWIIRPGVLVLVAIGVLVILRTFLSSRRATNSAGRKSPGQQTRSSLKVDVALTLAMFTILLAAAATATAWPRAAAMSPIVVSVIGMLTGAVLLTLSVVRLLRARRASTTNQSSQPASDAAHPHAVPVEQLDDAIADDPLISAPATKVFTMVTWCLSLIAAVGTIGLAAGIALFTFIFLRVRASVKSISAAIYALVLAVGIDLLFVGLLHFRPPAALFDLYTLIVH